MAFEPEAAATAEQAADEGTEVDANVDADVPDAQPKRRRLESKILSLEYHSRCFLPRFLTFALSKSLEQSL